MVEPALAIEPAALGPAEAFRRAIARERLAFLDGRAAQVRAPCSHLAWDPAAELRLSADATDPLRAIDDFLAAESSRGRTVIGVLGYELAHWIEPLALVRTRARMPIAALSSYAREATYDHRLDAWIDPPPVVGAPRLSRCEVGDLRAAIDEPEYHRLFERARRWIGAGDVYQVNLSIRFDATIAGDPAALYERLSGRHAVPYGAYLDFGDFQVLSNSPELFLARRGDRIETRPIKGTRPRGESRAEDARRRLELATSEKDRAEHVMIVDLERSDLGRVAATGSVAVAELEAIATYPTLHHLESSVVARVRPGARFSGLLRATFPGGSITGAPKVRAIQIIDELEAESRELYTGAILHHPPNGDFTMSLAIRTATVAGGRLAYSAGGGLVSDSTPAAEWAECQLKARAMRDALGNE